MCTFWGNKYTGMQLQLSSSYCGLLCKKSVMKSVFFLFWGCSAHGLIITHLRSTLIIFFWIMIVNTGWAKDGQRLRVFTPILNLWFGSISTAGGGWWRQRYRIRGDRFTPSNPSNRPPDKTRFSRTCYYSCVFKALGSNMVWFTESRS